MDLTPFNPNIGENSIGPIDNNLSASNASNVEPPPKMPSLEKAKQELVNRKEVSEEAKVSVNDTLEHLAEHALSPDPGIKEKINIALNFMGVNPNTSESDQSAFHALVKGQIGKLFA